MVWQRKKEESGLDRRTLSLGCQEEGYFVGGYVVITIHPEGHKSGSGEDS